MGEKCLKRNVVGEERSCSVRTIYHTNFTTGEIPELFPNRKVPSHQNELFRLFLIIG